MKSSPEQHAAQVHTLTYDNGKEFAYHQDVAEKLAATGYFTLSHHSWECGPNENMNGLIRQYVLKGENIGELTDAEVCELMGKLNNGLRK